MTDFRALCVELINELHGYKVSHPNHDTDLIDRARATLAEPEPEGPTDEDLMALAAKVFDDPFATDKDYARAVLARWGR